VTVVTDPEVTDVAVMAAEIADKAAATVAATTAADLRDKAAIIADRKAAETAADLPDKAATATEDPHSLHVRVNLHRKEAVSNDIPEKS